MSVISLTIKAVDNASRTLGSIGRSLGDLNARIGATGAASGNAQSGVQGLVGSIRSGIVQAQLLGAAFTGAMNVGRSAFGALTGSLQQAQGIQLQNIQAASTFASLTGQSYEQAAQFVDSFNAKIAKSAAALPGETEQYAALARTISDSVLPAFQTAGGKLDQSGFEDSLASITTSFAALSAAGNIDLSNTSLSLTQALGGASVASLRQLQLFQNNPILLNAIEKGLEEAGAKSLADLDISKRVQIIQDAGAKLITEDFKTQSTRAADGLIQSFKSSIFDPTTGIFGVMRDLDMDKSGVQSVFSSFNETLLQLIGPQGIFFQASSILAKLGLTFDPMQTIKSGLDVVNVGLNRVNQAVAGLQGFVDAGGSAIDTLRLLPTYLGLSGGLGGIGEKLTEGLDYVVGQASAAIEAIFPQLPPIINQGIGVGIQFVKSLNWASIGGAVGRFAGVLLGETYKFVYNLDYGQILVGIGQLGIGIVQAIGGFFGGLLPTLYPRMQEAYGALGNQILAALSLIADAAKGAISSVLDPIIGGIEGLIKPIANFISNLLGQLAQTAAGIPGLGSLVSAVTPAAPGNEPLRQTVGSRAEGQYPSAIAGLLSAATFESRRAPAGASLVVANTSELIANQQQVKGAIAPPAAAIMARSVPIPAQANARPTIMGGIHFTISGAGDPDAIADRAVAKIQRLFEVEMSAQLG